MWVVNNVVAKKSTFSQKIGHAHTGYRSNEMVHLSMYRVQKAVDPVRRIVAVRNEKK